MRICSHGKLLRYIAIPIHKIKMRGSIQIDYKTDIGYCLYITIAGNYAKVLNFNNPGRYINNKWVK